MEQQSRLSDDLASDYSTSKIDEGQEPLLNGAPEKRISSIKSKRLRVWIGVVFLFVLLGSLSTSLSNSNPALLRTYETGFASDLESVRSEIEMVQTTFTGGVELDNDGSYYRDSDGAETEYVGEPSLKIDTAWHKLLNGLNFDLSSTDVTHLNGTTYRWKDDHYYFSGLSVFHSLHCLNRLRQALHPDFYNIEDPNDPSHEMHVDHCIDHLRQALQCHSDLTPMLWKKRGNRLILKNGGAHTCRNFDKIHDWASDRQIDYTKKQELADGELHIVD